MKCTLYILLTEELSSTDVGCDMIEFYPSMGYYDLCLPVSKIPSEINLNAFIWSGYYTHEFQGRDLEGVYSAVESKCLLLRIGCQR